MRPIIFFILVFLTGLTSCKKENSERENLQGTWELRRASGMITTTYAPGTGRQIRFDGNRYEMIENGQVTRSGTFIVIDDNSVEEATCSEIPDGQYEKRIIYDNDFAATKVFFQFSGGGLYLISGCFALDSGVVYEYAPL